MYQDEDTSVMRCRLCRKPFDNESTLKRHGYYCRSRKSGKVVRIRSCLSCVAAKTRCDNVRPRCSRCTAKAVECQYRPESLKAAKLGEHKISSARAPQGYEAGVFSPEVSGIETQSEMYQEQSAIKALTGSELLISDFGGSQPDWNVDYVHSKNSWDHVIDMPVETDPSFLFPFSMESDFQIQQAKSSLNLTAIPPPLTQNIRSISTRTKPTAAFKRTSSLMLSVLKSYPRMLRQNSNPPFIHSSSLSPSDATENMESLYNCMHLMCMLDNGIQGNRKLFWKNVQMECERIRAEYKFFDKWEFLAAMQALSLYILLRIEEGETDHNNHDALLLSTVTAVAKQFAYTHSLATTKLITDDRRDSNQLWRDWIMEESLRRLCVMYQVINMLVHFEPATMCDLPSDLLIAPLPSKKRLWEAESAYTWSVETSKEVGLEMSFGLLASGDLVRLDAHQVKCKGSKPINVAATAHENWDEWCSGMDGFGGLIMLAASLVA